MSWPTWVSPDCLQNSSTKPMIRKLWFDTSASPFAGDLGLLISSVIRPEDALVRVSAWGEGSFNCSRCRLPDGISLEVVVVPSARGGVPVWTESEMSSEPLYELSRANLSLSGVVLARTGTTRPRPLIKLREGHFLIQNCRFREHGEPSAERGGMIDFQAPGGLPSSRGHIGLGTWPFQTRMDRPTCVIIDSVLISTAGILTADVARGLVALSGSVVASGESAFTLKPNGSAAESFEADLWLNHCTVAAEKRFVNLGRWTGVAQGPDRPWLVSTEKCAFFAAFQRPAKDAVLLHADPESLAHGTLFWQATGDTFQVPRFLSTGDRVSREEIRSEFVREWSKFWGAHHVRAVTGPKPPDGTMSARTVVRLRPGHVEPGDLAIDTSYHVDPGPPRDIGADFQRLGILPTPRTVPRR